MAFTPKLYLLTIFFLLVLTLSLILILTIHSRSLSATSSDGTSYNAPRRFSYLPHVAATYDDETCLQAYGFMPCSTSWIGNLFLILVYGYLTYLGATLSSTGSELLLESAKPGNIGGSLLSILNALRSALLVLVSGLSKSVEAAQTQVHVGVGLLARSTILLLSIIWGCCVVVGKCNLQDSGASEKVNTRGYSLTGSGVYIDIWTSYAAVIMGISTIPFIIVQVPQILNSTSGRHLAILIALVVSIALLIAYCMCQVFQPWIQQRNLEIFDVLRNLRRRVHGRLMKDDREVDEEAVKKLFKKIDENDDGYLSASELKALMVGIRFEEIGLDRNEAIKKIMRDFDTSQDSQVDEREFVGGMTRWLKSAAGPAACARDSHETRGDHTQLLVGDQSEEEGVVNDNPKPTFLKPVLLLALGTIIAAAFADPLVAAVINFSDTANINAFFTSFITLPLAINSRDAISVITIASRKTQRTTSLTFSNLYAIVTMNNVFCLSVFLALVYIRGLTWDFSVEALIILVVCVLIGALASFRTTYPLWMSLVAFLLYPSSLALVYVLNYALGWS